MSIIKPNRKIKILFTGGDSGGHVFPIISILHEMQKFEVDFQKQGLDLDFYYIGSDDFTLDYVIKEAINIFPLRIKKYKRSIQGLPVNVINFFVNFWAFVKAYFKMLRIMPDLIIAKGSFASSFALLVGVIFRIPIFIHESDAIPGFVNQFFGRFAKIVFISFKDSSKYLKNKNIEVVGNPMRDDLIEISKIKDDQSLIKKSMGLTPEKKLLLVLGGSQGAQTINNLILDALPDLIRNYEIIHQVGENNFIDIKRQSEVIFHELIDDASLSKYYHVIPFLSDKKVPQMDSLGFAMLASDLIISRGGSGSIFEIAAFNKPSIIIPLPWASRHHQEANAFEYSRNKACITLEQENLKPNLLSETIDNLLVDNDRLERMKSGAQSFAKMSASSDIARIVLKTIVKKYI